MAAPRATRQIRFARDARVTLHSGEETLTLIQREDCIELVHYKDKENGPPSRTTTQGRTLDELVHAAVSKGWQR